MTKRRTRPKRWLGARGVLSWCGKAVAREQVAQATLEYALTVGAFMAVIAGLALLWHAGTDGVFAHLIEEASSHALDGLGVLDIALY